MLEIDLGIIITEGIKVPRGNKTEREGIERREKGAQDITQEISAWLISIADLLCVCHFSSLLHYISLLGRVTSSHPQVL